MWVGEQEAKARLILKTILGQDFYLDLSNKANLHFTSAADIYIANFSNI